MKEVDFLKNLVFLVDTREKRRRLEGFNSRRATLHTGDLSIAGLQESVACEMKALEDLLACFGRSRERFEKELQRARSFRHFFVVVEAPLSRIIDGEYQNQINPKAAFETIMSFQTRYPPVSFWFGRNAAEAEMIAVSLLKKAARQCYREFSGIAKASGMTKKKCRPHPCACEERPQTVKTVSTNCFSG